MRKEECLKRENNSNKTSFVFKFLKTLPQNIFYPKPYALKNGGTCGSE